MTGKHSLNVKMTDQKYKYAIHEMICWLKRLKREDVRIIKLQTISSN